ncbi:MAG: cytochrome c biogenesis protein CcsA [Chitinispirillaceae bacterium]|nr:cytochrome c biogenesis protein CcsA [Chitinispirillaceae bacterium]
MSRNHRAFALQRRTVFALLLAVFLVPVIFAEGQGGKPAPTSRISLQSFERIIVVESGRKKPLATFARNKLLQYSGKKRGKKLSASEWLARLMFDPSSVDAVPVFLINDPQVALALGIEPRAERRYRYAELYPSAEKLGELSAKARMTPAKERSPFEREIVRVRNNLSDYASLASVFTFDQPHEGFRISDSALAAQLGLSGRGEPPSYADLLNTSHLLSEAMRRMQAAGIDNLSAADSVLFGLARSMYHFGSSIGNPIPHCIPFISDGEEQWLSPWGLVGVQRRAALEDPCLDALRAAKDAFVKADQQAFDAAVHAFNESVVRKAGVPDPSLELIYNRIDPFPVSKILFGIAAIIALIIVFSGARPLHIAGISLAAAGLVITTTGIFLRMIIMGRPPVTNLYETFVFVAWASVVIGLVLEWMGQQPIGILVSSVTGFLFLHVAGRYALDGDTMGMLAAVLDSSFWLATHIVTIALGYAGCVGAGAVGHIYLIRCMMKKADYVSLQALDRSVYGVLCFGLLFTVIGTVFGGMWADQAWGRFWGWDPKENGALLIILWCLVVLHSRQSGMIKGIGTALGAVISTLLVMYTWIGVNLLGVGLHSYGFTSAGARALLLYTSLEALFVAVFIMVTAMRNRSLKRG